MLNIMRMRKLVPRFVSCWQSVIYIKSHYHAIHFLTANLYFIANNLYETFNFVLKLYSLAKSYLAYYAGIMLDAFSNVICSKLCWHNRPGPTCYLVMY